MIIKGRQAVIPNGNSATRVAYSYNKMGWPIKRKFTHLAYLSIAQFSYKVKLERWGWGGSKVQPNLGNLIAEVVPLGQIERPRPAVQEYVARNFSQM